MARNKEFIQEEKLNKAKELFWKKGYLGTSMQDLVSSTGLNPGSIYGTFGNKHQLFLDSLKLYCKEMTEQYQQTIDENSQSPLCALERAIDKAIDIAFKADKACMAVKTSFEIASADSEVRQILTNQADDIRNMMAELIHKAQQTGEISRTENPQIIAAFILSNFAGFWHLQNLYQDINMVKMMATFLMNSLR